MFKALISLQGINFASRDCTGLAKAGVFEKFQSPMTGICQMPCTYMYCVNKEEMECTIEDLKSNVRTGSLTQCKA